MTENPLVSIVIPTYNSAHYLSAALDSCLAQTYPHCEIIVIDDGSTDGTREMISSRYGDRVRYIYQDNAGAAVARNRGLEAARGELVQFCDADDILLPDKISRCVAVFQQRPDVALVYTRYQYVAQDGVMPLPIDDPPLLHGYAFCDLLRNNGNAMLTSATMIRRAVVEKTGLFDPDPRLRCGEDWDFFLRITASYSVESIDEILVHYRYHERGISRSAYCNALGRLTVIQRARHYPGRAECLDDEAYDQLVAARHHVLAMVLWREGQRAEARAALRAAIRLDPQHSTMRRLYVMLCYALPFQVTQWIRRLRNVVGPSPCEGRFTAPFSL